MLSEETLAYLKNRRKVGATKSLLIGSAAHDFPLDPHHLSTQSPSNNQLSHPIELPSEQTFVAREECCNHRSNLKKAVECIESLQMKVNTLTEENTMLKNYIKKFLEEKPSNPLKEKNVFAKGNRLNSQDSPAFHLQRSSNKFTRDSSNNFSSNFKENQENFKENFEAEFQRKSSKSKLEISPSFSNISKDVYVIEDNFVRGSFSQVKSEENPGGNYGRTRSVTEVGSGMNSGLGGNSVNLGKGSNLGKKKARDHVPKLKLDQLPNYHGHNNARHMNFGVEKSTKSFGKAFS